MEKKQIGIPKPTKEARLKERIERLKLKAKIKKEPKLSDLKKIVQRKVNAYVRERDKDLPCISCGKFRKLEAGHYWRMGSYDCLRYNLDNLAGQCHDCNRWKSGNQGEYRIGLIARIGEERVVWLDEHRNDEKKWSREELQLILDSLI